MRDAIFGIGIVVILLFAVNGYADGRGTRKSTTVTNTIFVAIDTDADSSVVQVPFTTKRRSSSA